MSPGRYERLDSDEERLPEGMQRIGYDADEQVYTYRDAEGNLWEGQGERYGLLYRVGERPTISASEAATSAALRKAQDRAAWRYMFPFFLLIAVFLLFVFKITHPSGGFHGGGDAEKWPDPLCEKGEETYGIVKGDTCWDLAQRWGTTVEELIQRNEQLDCDSLQVGRRICVPSNEET